MPTEINIEAQKAEATITSEKISDTQIKVISEQVFNIVELETERDKIIVDKEKFNQMVAQTLDNFDNKLKEIELKLGII
jgi:hypothetical protein